MEVGSIATILNSYNYFFDYRKEQLPYILLSQKGILDSIEWVSYGLILWEDIRTDEQHKNLIFIDVTNPEKYIAQLRTNKRFSECYKSGLRKDSFCYGTPVFLNTKNLSETNETILSIMKEYQNKRKKLFPSV